MGISIRRCPSRDIKNVMNAGLLVMSVFMRKNVLTLKPRYINLTPLN
jgi:hypothetical protein